jgi:5-methylcytosine-specific restriction endonuclease McrA
MNALRAFVDYANGTGTELAEQQVGAGVDSKHKTGRDPSLRLRWRVLQRDNSRCCACGSSPAITLGVELHVDHIHPWSEGGETVLENLQTLCSKCNLGKSNLLIV